MKLIIITGLSGSGKSTALHALEDRGVYCIDNLPLGLLPTIARYLEKSHDKMAVGIDARNLDEDFRRFPPMVAALRRQGMEVRTIFLDAKDETLLARFSETRRRHPLSGEGFPLLHAIQRERELLEPLIEQADLRIDTSSSHIHELRRWIQRRIMEDGALSLLLKSFGFKHGLPPDADFVFDVRCLPNPHWQPHLRMKTGKDPEVQAFLSAQPQVREMLASLKDLLVAWIPHFEAQNRSYLTVAVGCTGGQHRSVYLVECLADCLQKRYNNLSVCHRELE
ncbi:MAG: RNase adapter RapZ [Gammaproteobacteria bacterium]|nr:MAG: RNase adapter RapZ [Gammaproteobacteria bacterium]